MQDMVNFEDLYPLFGLNTYNRNLIRMDFDEASYVYKLVKSMYRPLCVEIGTYLGGSTVLMASAGGDVITVDNYCSITFEELNNPALDVEELLNSFGVRSHVQIIVADSRTYDTSKIKCDILLIDGDHSYEGVKADYKNWKDTVKKGGHILFHDSCRARKGATGRPEIEKFLKELGLKPFHQIGSITHYII